MGASFLNPGDDDASDSEASVDPERLAARSQEAGRGVRRSIYHRAGASTYKGPAPTRGLLDCKRAFCVTLPPAPAPCGGSELGP